MIPPHVELLRHPCPSCRLRLRLPVAVVGRSVRCPRCGTRFVASDSSATAASTAETPTPTLLIAVPQVADLPPALDTPAVPAGRWRALAVAAGVAVCAGGLWGAVALRRPAEVLAVAPAEVAAVAPAAPVGAAPDRTPVVAVVAPSPMPTAPAVPVPAPVAVVEPPAPAPAAPAAPAPVVQVQAAAPRPAAPPPDPKAVLERVKGSVALVEGKFGHGSGFVVLPGVVATNSHVVLNDLSDDVTVRFSTDGLPDEKGYKARLLYEDKARDLVLLWLAADPGRPPLPLAAGFSPAGRPEVSVVGNPGQGGGAALSNTVGTVRCEEEVALIDGKPYYRLQGPAAGRDITVGPGNSGGPVVDRDGRVIGVLTRAEVRAGVKGPERLTGRAYCIPHRAVREALDAVGPAAGWDERAKRAAARHALDIVAVNRHLNAELARTVIDERVGVVQEAGNGVVGFGFFVQPDWSRFRRKDQDLTALFAKADKRFEKITAPAVQVVTDSGLTGPELDPVRGIKAELGELRKTAMSRRFLDGEYKLAKERSDRCRLRFQDYCKANGLGPEFVKLMIDAALDGVND